MSMNKTKLIKQVLIYMLIFYAGFVTNRAFFQPASNTTTPNIEESINKGEIDTGTLSDEMIALIKEIYGSEERAADMSSIIGKDFPDFELTTMTGKQVKLSDYKGKRVVIEMVANWCSFCQEASKNYIDAALEANPDLEFLQLFIEGDEEEVKAFYETIGKPDSDLSNVIPASKDTMLIANEINLNGFPTAVFVNTEGKIVWLHAGIMDERITTFVNENVLNDSNLMLNK